MWETHGELSGTSPWKIMLSVSSKSKCTSTLWPASTIPGIYPREVYIYSQKDLHKNVHSKICK